jgi:alpha-amylase
MKALPSEAKKRGITFSTPSEICGKTKSAGPLSVPFPITWVDEERDISSWLGNTMQRDAFDKLYSVADRVRICNDRRIMQDWDYLQATNNFRFMSTKPSSAGAYRGIYDSPYDAFTNYMNIIGDFITRVNNLYPDVDNEELSSLMTTIKNQEDELMRKNKEIEKLRQTLEHLSPDNDAVKAKPKVKRTKKTKP